MSNFDPQALEQGQQPHTAKRKPAEDVMQDDDPPAIDATSPASELNKRLRPAPQQAGAFPGAASSSLFTVGVNHGRSTSSSSSSNGSALFGVSALSQPSFSQPQFQEFRGDIASDAQPGAAPPVPSPPPSASPPAAEGPTEEFETLMEHLASLRFDFSPSTDEACPLCFKIFPWKNFAAHVYSCLTRLQIEEDEKLARKLAAEMTDAEDTSRRTSPAAQRSSRYSYRDDVPVCEDGELCTRTDHGHFLRCVHPSSHPSAVATLENHPQCLICPKRVPYPLLNEHVNRCLEALEQVVELDNDDQDMEGAGVKTKAEGPSTSPLSPQRHAPARDPFSATFRPTDLTFSQIRDPTRQEQDGAMSDDEEDDGERKESSPAIRSPTPAAMGRLSTRQLAACADLALKVKRNCEEEGDSKQYLKLLQQLESLGFTEENIKKSLHDSAPPGGSSSSSSSHQM